MKLKSSINIHQKFLSNFRIFKEFYYNIFIIIFFKLFVRILSECNRNVPIKLSNGTCVIKYCTKNEYDSKECTLNNSIIKTQFPNNIIFVGEKMFRYLNFLTFSNGDMIFETSPFPPSNKRIFYGLKKNGRPYFKKENSNEETPFNYLIADNENEFKYESGNSIIRKETKEYYLTIGRLETYTEIYDFTNKKIISTLTKDLINCENKNMKSNLINIGFMRNTYIFSCLTKIDDIETAVIMKFNLKLENNEIYFSNCIRKEIGHSFGEIGSCFFTEKSQMIICFYLFSESFFNTYFLFIAIDKEFNFLIQEKYNPPLKSIYAYFYSIFFKEDAGAFVYYKFESQNFYPVIFFKEFNMRERIFKDHFLNNNEIILDKYIFNVGHNYNDLIKISNNKLGFFTASMNLEVIYIIILNFYNINNLNNIKIRYYSIEIYQLLNYKVSDDIKPYIFNNFIILGSSICIIETCSYENPEYYSSLMMIGYPNNKDTKFDIINYLLLDNNNSIDNLKFNLSENITIDNNIFGYILDSIEIKNIRKIGNINLISSITNEKIDDRKKLNKDEILKIEFINNIYIKFDCLTFILFILYSLKLFQLK